MKYRRFGRQGWMVSDIGYGMWGMGRNQWSGANDDESLLSLQKPSTWVVTSLILPGLMVMDTARVTGKNRSSESGQKTLYSLKDSS